jgi:hypothetical protein
LIGEAILALMPSLGRALRTVPAARLVVLGELLLLAREHLAKLEPHERRRIVELVRRGRGRPRNLTDRDRRELARLVEKAEPREFLRSAAKRTIGLRDRGHNRDRGHASG